VAKLPGDKRATDRFVRFQRRGPIIRNKTLRSALLKYVGERFVLAYNAMCPPAFLDGSFSELLNTDMLARIPWPRFTRA
jgi:hypothetical protein